eukprot:864611-Pelagomonas_calceolata.AAC.1
MVQWIWLINSPPRPYMQGGRSSSEALMPFNLANLGSRAGGRIVAHLRQKLEDLGKQADDLQRGLFAAATARNLRLSPWLILQPRVDKEEYDKRDVLLDTQQVHQCAIRWSTGELKSSAAAI